MKKRMRRGCFLSLLLAGFLIGAFLGKTVPAVSGFFITYLNREENGLYRLEFVPGGTSDQQILDEIMARFNDMEHGNFGGSLFVDGLQIEGTILEGDLLKVSLSPAYRDLEHSRAVLIRAGLCEAFLQLPCVRTVRILVGEEPLTDLKGEVLPDADSETFVGLWEEEGGTEDYRYDTFELYFTDETGEFLVPEKRTLFYKRSLPRERVIIEQLIKGPLEDGHYRTIPGRTVLKSVTVSDRICYLDFSEDFANYELGLPMNTMIYSVVNSIVGAGLSDRVEILVEGQDDLVLGAEVPLYQFFGWNEDILYSHIGDTRVDMEP